MKLEKKTVDGIVAALKRLNGITEHTASDVTRMLSEYDVYDFIEIWCPGAVDGKLVRCDQVADTEPYRLVFSLTLPFNADEQTKAYQLIVRNNLNKAIHDVVKWDEGYLEEVSELIHEDDESEYCRLQRMYRDALEDDSESIRTAVLLDALDTTDDGRFPDAAAQYLRDVQHGGCASGMVSDMVYTSDVRRFVLDHLEEIDDLIQEWQEDVEPITFPSNLPILTFLGWFAYEKVTNDILSELENA